MNYLLRNYKDKMNSLNDAEELHDLESEISSGLSPVPRKVCRYSEFLVD